MEFSTLPGSRRNGHKKKWYYSLLSADTPAHSEFKVKKEAAPVHVSTTFAGAVSSYIFKTKVCMRWKQTNHINVLEQEPVMLSVRHMLKYPQNLTTV